MQKRMSLRSVPTPFTGRRHSRRSFAQEALFLAVFVVLAAVVLYVLLRPPPVPADGQVPGGRVGARVQTEWGVLEESDRKLLVAVRQAGLWEGPAGDQATQRGERPRVRQVGALLAEEHARLDEIVRAVAAELDVVLPAQPTGEQQAWLSELSRLSGDGYDRRWVHLLRVAHGKVYGAIAKVRASTGNSKVRDFADVCSTFVQRHMTYLDSTGLVNFREVHREVT